MHFFAPYFEKHLPLISYVVVYGYAGYGSENAGRLAYVQRLKHYQTQPLGAKWQNKLEDLTNKLEFKKAGTIAGIAAGESADGNRLFETGDPGAFRRVNGLSEKQVEAILAHELAHIYRHDYFLTWCRPL